MPNFDYIATHDDGREIRGTAEGASQEEVIQRLALEGMLVTKIAAAQHASDPVPTTFDRLAPTVSPQAPIALPRQEPQKSAGPQDVESAPWLRGNEVAPIDGPRATPAVSRADELSPDDRRSYFATNVWGPLAGQVPLTDLAFFFRQFSAMQNAGVPLVTTMGTLGKKAHFKLGRIISEIQASALEGKPVTYAMQRYPEVFNPMMISMLRAGEEGGFFSQTLSQLADYIQAEIQLRNLYRRATMYPKTVIVASILIISGANAIIAAVGGSSFIYSPLTNFAISGVLLAILLGFWVFLRVGLANPRVKYNWDAMNLRVPWLGPTLHQFAMAKFGRAFSALQKGGVPISRAVELAADACGNEYIRSKIHPAAAKLERGDGLAGTLAETGALGPIVLDMLHTGEMSGNVDSMLIRAAEYYEDDSEVRAKQLATVASVAAIVLVGIYVGYVVVGFYQGALAGPLRQQEQATGLDLILPFIG